ncbi:UNVERIFIED_CONTAM: Thioredoxin-like 1-1, chloroplastic [Sesamum latifolium]|uniref:Thioredoxin-like 1-1, chloroplastic n=1 Tax=Sesamum latifolium TaxID=2727402 RepID=A0AAW2UIR7_9LAMI
MSCSLKAGFSVYGSSVLTVENRAKGSFRVCSSIDTLQFKEPIPNEFLTKTFHVSDQKPVDSFSLKAPKLDPAFNAQPSLCRGQALRWWEKSLHPNMIEIQSAQELVISLLNAGDRLVVLDFYSPSCGACKTLHPKIKKFKDALAKHGNGGGGGGPSKGLHESELVALASNDLISRDLVMNSSVNDKVEEELVLA